MEKVYILEPNGQFKIDRVEKVNLEYMQSVIGGCIDIPFVSEVLQEKGIDVVVADEQSFDIRNDTSLIVINDDEVVSITTGKCILCGVDDEGKSVGLNEEQVDFIKENFRLSIFGFDGDVAFKTFAVSYK